MHRITRKVGGGEFDEGGKNEKFDEAGNKTYFSLAEGLL